MSPRFCNTDGAGNLHAHRCTRMSVTNGIITSNALAALEKLSDALGANRLDVRM